MAIYGTIYSSNNKEIIKLYTSSAQARQNSFRIHYHPVIEFCFCISGSGIYQTKEKIYPFAENDFFMFRANELHCITDILNQDGMQLINLHISPEFLLNNPTLTKFFHLFSLSSKLITHKISELNFSTLCLSTITSLKDELINKKPGYEEVSKNLVINMLINIARALQNKQFNAARLSSRNISFAKKILDEIDIHYTNNISLEELSKKVNYNKNYVCMFFKQTFGVTIWEYITIKRINESLNLIRNSNLSITDIYLKCGFNNSANFNKQFRKYTGKSPKDFR